MTIRRLALAALAGQLVWLAFIVFGGLWEPGYSEIRDAVSFLGARDAAGPWVFDTVVAISDLSLFALGGALVLDAPRGLRGRVGPALIALTGLAWPSGWPSCRTRSEWQRWLSDCSISMAPAPRGRAPGG